MMQQPEVSIQQDPVSDLTGADIDVLNQEPRKSEPRRNWFRSGRVYLRDTQCWYFRTREGIDLGPYESQFEAEVESGLLREMIKEIEDEGDRRAVIRQFVLDSHQVGHTLKPLFEDERRLAIFI